ncbi:MAG: glycosyltransferase family 4 protein [Candidatus Parvarchaeota archaeon]|jgi:glycosyltransferase involved in cell wall biosynthesis|nr:glycosyltransferase family 4 protein [Candidatus Parvarchaeota archaeon]
MRILFLGWEFPPHSVGGLGTHSYNLIRALSAKGIKIDLVLPFKDHLDIPGVNFLTFEGTSFKSIYSLSGEKNDSSSEKTLYNNIFNEVEEYKNKALKLQSKTAFDVIHANDWVTGRAAIEIKKKTGKKLIATIHSTEYDRTAGNPWKEIEREEKDLMDNADVIVTVSARLKDELVKVYNMDERKIKVVYNAINKDRFGIVRKKDANKKVILYVGRLSVQKGVENLIRAFKIVSEKDKDAVLYIVGEGSEMANLINLSINLELADRIIFLGRAPDEEVELLYSIAKVFVMPSISEPFGIVALEAIASRVPTIMSSQSGVSEVIRNALKVDFWDVQQMADLIAGLLSYSEMNSEISKEAYKELNNITWEKAADEFIQLYSG